MADHPIQFKYKLQSAANSNNLEVFTLQLPRTFEGTTFNEMMEIHQIDVQIAGTGTNGTTTIFQPQVPYSPGAVAWAFTTSSTQTAIDYSNTRQFAQHAVFVSERQRDYMNTTSITAGTFTVSPYCGPIPTHFQHKLHTRSATGAGRPVATPSIYMIHERTNWGGDSPTGGAGAAAYALFVTLHFHYHRMPTDTVLKHLAYQQQ